MNAPLITLTTDFGQRDPYVAAMKGVILSILPEARVLDLSHDIAPGGILEGALFLAGALPYFPFGTIHVAVIDPGVGTDRLPIAIRIGGRFLVCPNNGLITLVSRAMPIEAAHAISNPAFIRDAVSATFHGRDVFAPAAARLAGGAPLDTAGDAIETVEFLAIPEAYRTRRSGIRGEIIHVDRFGNLITNIHYKLIGDTVVRRVNAGSAVLNRISRTYGDVRPNETLALIGSNGQVEIAVNQGNAQTTLGLGVGDSVEIT